MSNINMWRCQHPQCGRLNEAFIFPTACFCGEPRPGIRTEEQWITLAAGTIHSPSLALIHAVGELCYERQEKGTMPNSIWHSLSIITGKSCHCRSCEAP